MRSAFYRVAIGVSLLSVPSTGISQPAPTIANLSTCRLQSGDSISACRIGYRTFGKLNEARDNAVLIPTWFSGRSHELIPWLGSAAMVDTTRFFAILVDALGNGVSSSPSNTSRSPAAQFPGITIRDMVEAQYRLVREHLGVRRLHAVLGGSMGGMQVLEWGVAHPDYVARLVALTGSPRPGTYERVNWTTQLTLIEHGRRHGVPDDSIYLQLARLSGLLSTTPTYVNELTPGRAESAIRTTARNLAAAIRLEDYVSQLRAMLAHDVSAHFGSDLQQAAAQFRPQSLVVFSPDDHVVTAAAAESFARQLGAETLSVPSKCGHAVLVCESATINSAVRAFLGK